MSKSKAEGTRSPRWGVNLTMLIRCRNDEPYLFRRRLLQTPWFGVYVHDIFEADADPDPHDHPWTFRALVLRGSYTELLHPLPWVDVTRYREQHWRRWSWHKMTRETAHRIIHAEPGLKTLIFVGKRHKDWGFFTAPWGGYVPWQEYEREPEQHHPACVKYGDDAQCTACNR